MRLGLHKNFTRIVFDLKKPFQAMPHLQVDTTAITFSSDEIMNFSKVSSLPKALGLVKKVSKNGKHALIIHLTKACKIKDSFPLHATAAQTHPRFVIDLEAAPQNIVTKNLNSVCTEAKKTPPKPLEKKVIIIDAGHGGVDPGTLSYSRKVSEKHVTLSVAKILAKQLEATGKYRCVLTRKRDQFVKLGKRLDTIMSTKSDLFISLHADSSPQKDLRGLAVYTLSSIASDREAARLAKKENEADRLGHIESKHPDPQVSHILVDLVKRETMNLSIHLAHTLTDTLRQEVLLLRKPHRSADFYVLRSPQTPSILIELGYLSNKYDEAFLTSQSYQEKICAGLVTAINTYFQKHDVSDS